MNFWSVFVIFFLIFIVITGFIIFIFATILRKGIKQVKQDNNSPILEVDAKVIAKRSMVSGNNMIHQSYYVTFEEESGKRMELRVEGSIFGLLVEGDFGKLTFQGSRFLNFERRY